MSFDTTLRPDPFIGRSLGAYRLTERIADVRVGAAFVAEHRYLARRAVVKLFQPAPPGAPGGGLPRVEARVRALSRTRHEGILPLVDVGEGDGGLVFVALELEDEEALATLAVRGQAALPWRQVQSVGRQIAGAMRWAAGQGVAPPDLAAAQIFVAPGGAAGHEPRARIDVVTLEALGLREPPPRAEADYVLAVGRALYLLLTGRTSGAVGPDVSTGPVPGRLGLDLPADAEALVMRALDPDPGKRWPDLGALHHALGGLDADVAAASPSGAPGRAWFVSAESAAPAPASAPAQSEGETLAKTVTTAGDRQVAAAFDDHDFDRFGGPGADFGGDFSPDLHDDADFDGAEGSFGAKSVFARPSRRALISAGVAGGVALALLVVVVGTRVKVTQKESPSPSGPETSQVPGTPGTDGGGAPRAELDGAIAAPPSGVVPGTSAPVTAAAEAPVGPAAPAGPAPVATTAEVPAAGATSHAGAISARPAPGPPSAPGGAAITAARTGAAPSVPSVPPVPGPPAASAFPGAGSEPTPAAASAPPPGPNRPASPEAPGASPGDVAHASPQEVAEAIPAPGPPAAPAPAVPGTPGEEATSVSPSGRCAVTLGSKPWADVWIDGRRAGFSPMNDLPIACGTHEIVFTSRELGVERRISLTLRPGETVKRVVDLEAPAPGEAGARNARSECRLSLGSRPWAEVWIDGRRAGVTPLVSLPVRCGKHELLFFSRETNVEHRETIVVPEGQSVKKVVTLVEGE